jgi:ABC-type sugar transport system substrate-binding protein/AraC-like DNA-binding protein
MNDEIRLWGSRRRSAPSRPEFPELYPETDERHWYDLEYAGWGVAKVNLPASPRNGPAGKRMVCIHHLQGHPYMADYDGGMAREAERFGISLEIYHSELDPEIEEELVEKAIRSRPDLIVLAPENTADGTSLLRRINEAGIPVIASNLLPEAEGHRYCLAWTGPDDWGQFRLLARKFADLMGHEGGFCLVDHIPGSSAFYARKWAVTTELARIAPRMELLDSRATSLRTDVTKQTVHEWLASFGDRLRGIISADDSLAQLGINQALAEGGRGDVIRVACGATGMGLRFLREGSLKAITAQSPELDGALPVRVAVDWWNGLDVEPVRYLPIDLVEPEGIEDFLLMRHGDPDIDLDALARVVAECDMHGLDRFFGDLLDRFRHGRILSEEWFRGFSIELLSRLTAVARSAEIPTAALTGGYESLFKQLFQQRSPRDTLAWLEGVARRIMASAEEKRRGCLSLGDRVRLFVDEHWREPLSLKLLSSRFGMSAAYLGKVFREESGKSFATYLNELRIGQAERILATRKVKAKDVALAVGYSDANYFYSVFRKVTGRYPSEKKGGMQAGGRDGEY